MGKVSRKCALGVYLEFIEYLKKAPGFLRGKDAIKTWCGKADWPAKGLM